MCKSSLSPRSASKSTSFYANLPPISDSSFYNCETSKEPIDDLDEYRFVTSSQLQQRTIQTANNTNPRLRHSTRSDTGWLMLNNYNKYLSDRKVSEK